MRMRAQRRSHQPPAHDGLAHAVRNPLNAACLQLLCLKRTLQTLAGAEAASHRVAVIERELARVTQAIAAFVAGEEA